MQYGYFDKENKEYVVTRPDTPTPWINYIGQGLYGGIISNTAGGFSFDRDPRYRRITRYRYNNVPMDRPGRYIYIRDNKSREFWSPSWQPVMKNLDEYSCRHGMGYSKFHGKLNSISTQVTYFVPLDAQHELWMMKIKNEGAEKVDLSIFTYVEFCYWDVEQDAVNIDYTQNIGMASFEQNAIVLTTHSAFDGYTYFSCNADIAGYDCDREAFLGGYGSESNPAAVINGKCSNSSLHGGNGTGSLQCDLALEPGEEKEITFILGATRNKEEVFDVLSRFKQSDGGHEDFEKLNAWWGEKISRLHVETGDEDMDLLLNVWNQYQCKVTFDWSRFVSMYQTGAKRGLGVRDTSQDILGIMHSFPELARERSMDLIKNQFQRGDSYHLYYPLTGKGEKDGYSDDHLWIVLSVASYIKETGDFDLLDEIVPYADSGEASVYEHLQNAVNFSLTNVGPHGLPLIGFADWNDALNLTGENNQAESVWVAYLLHKALLEMVGISKALGKTTEEKLFTEKAEQLKATINEVAWDGEWYIRGFDDEGKPVGSSAEDEGRIYLNAQTWAVFSEVADEERTVKALDSARKYLNSKFGLKLLHPPYAQYRDRIGGLTTYPPGAKENAGIFCHTNPWMIIAEAMVGRGDMAFEYFKQLAPSAHNDISEIKTTEPYVYSQSIMGPDHPNFGKARNSWLSGTASWSLVAAANYIIGVRPDYNGLIVDPCVPKHWEGFKVKRWFRGALYDIEVVNRDRISKGVKTITVDGKTIESAVLPIFDDGGAHEVKIEMGESDAGYNIRESRDKREASRV